MLVAGLKRRPSWGPKGKMKESKLKEPIAPWLMVSAEDPAQAQNQLHQSLSHCLREDKQGEQEN